MLRSEGFERHWPENRRGAISLTYDGGLPEHFEIVGPDLSRRGLRGTFYVTPRALVQNAPIWRGLAMQGHEIGNGCLIDAAMGDGSLPRWTLEMVSLEVDSAQEALAEILPGQVAHSFGYPWGYSRAAGGSDIREVVDPQIEVARAGTDGMNAPGSCDLQFLRCMMADSWTGAELVRMAEATLDSGKWGIFAFEGVGSGLRGVDHAAHTMLLNWLASVQPQVWVDPVITVAGSLRSLRRGQLRVL